MTLLHSDGDELHGNRSPSLFSIAVASDWLRAAFVVIHEAIVAAKLRRLRSEFMLRELWAVSEIDVAKLPRRPAVLGDKWDF